MDRPLCILCCLAGASFIEAVFVVSTILEPTTSPLEIQALVFALIWLVAVFSVCVSLIILLLFGASYDDDGPKGREPLPEEKPTPLEMRGRSL